MPSGAIADCPHCGASLPLKSPAAIGKRANCPQCKQPFVVRLREEPGAAGTGDDEPPDEYALPDDIKAPPVMTRRGQRVSPAKRQAALEREAKQERRRFWVGILSALIWINANVAAAVCIIDSIIDFFWLLAHWEEVRRAAPTGRAAVRQLGRPLLVIITAAIIWWQGVLFRDRSARMSVLVFGGGYLLLFGLVALVIGLIVSSVYDRPVDAVQWSVVYFGASLLAFAAWGYGPESTLQRAERLTSEGRYSEALTAANLALQEDPDDRDALELQRAIRDMMRYA